MPSGDGYWLEPTTDTLHLVTTHNDWLLDPSNQQKVGLQREQVEVLRRLDPIKEIDEIRLVGLLHGLVRIRDYSSRVSVQFFAPTERVPELLKSVLQAMPHVTNDKFAYLTIQNLLDDSTAAMFLTDLQIPTLIKREPIDSNERLRQKVAGLLEKAKAVSG